jgi:hypothetical protein
MGDREVDPVEIVDQNAEAQKPCDAPSAPWDRVLWSRIHDKVGRPVQAMTFIQEQVKFLGGI